MNGSKKTSALNHEQFTNIVKHFTDKGDHRMAVVCMLLAQCVRIGDVLITLKVGDVYTISGVPKGRALFREQKTGKQKSISLQGANLFAGLRHLYQHLPKHREANLFYNANGTRLQDKGVKWHLHQFVGRWGVEQCSPHSFRKYGARYLFDKGYDIEIISQILNHSSVRETRTYLDIKQKDVEKAMEVLNF